ncbi:MAG: MATE family efflux transporter [Actinomycetota bacterium]|nr:MATE family efflux transporter [Actinomycetota bacterium]
MLSSMWSAIGSKGGHHREVLRLAVPAFVTLVAEPVFLLADAVVVGHLGTVPLAALGVAAAVLGALANVFVFLAYGTTGAVARRLGAGDHRGALALGVDGLWLALVLGVLAGLAMLLLARDLASWLGADGGVLGPATTYLRISSISLPAMLVNLASTGVLRGLQDTRTPLVVALIGFPVNVVLNVTLVYGAGLGIAGSAWGTALAQLGMAIALMSVVVRLARRDGAPLSAHPTRVLGAARDGLPLLLRTLSLRAVLLMTTWVAASLGVVSLAAYQVSSTVWTTLTFMLDALAIAGQALTGRYLGAGDVAGARAATRLMLWWGLGGGAVCAVGLVALHRVLPLAFTTDAHVRAALAGALIVVAIGQPLSGWVFVLDGVLIGAGDARWLAVMQLVIMLAYVPIALLVRAHAGDIATLWWGFTLWMLVRGLALGWRARGDAWLVTGASR